MSFTKINQKGLYVYYVVNVEGDLPSDRSLTAIASVGNVIYLFGGSKYGEAYNDTYAFNTGIIHNFYI